MNFKMKLLCSLIFLFLFYGCTKSTESNERADLTPIVDHGPVEHLTYYPDDIEWQKNPASLEKGAEIAILDGNPSKAEVFTLRLKLPDGFVIAPHWHPRPERVTVISGVFRLGSGREVNPEATRALKAGTYTSMPAGMEHFAIAEGETVIQLTSSGPWEIHYINPEDDPRNKEY